MTHKSNLEKFGTIEGSLRPKTSIRISCDSAEIGEETDCDGFLTRKGGIRILCGSIGVIERSIDDRKDNTRRIRTNRENPHGEYENQSSHGKHHNLPLP